MMAYHVHPSSSAHLDLITSNNASFIDAIQFDPPVPGVTGPAWTLTGYDFEMEIARNKTTAPLLTLTSDAAEIVVDSETDRVIHFDVADTVVAAALIPGTYIYDLIMYNDTTRIQLMHGKFTVTDGITGN
jgi:hypothetical protein